MKFDRRVLLSTIAAVAILVSSAAADEASSTIKRIAAATKNSIALIRCKTTDELGSRITVGTGISISPQIMMTYAVDSRIRTDKIESIEIIVPGVERQSFSGKLLGVDPATGLSFVQVPSSYPWRPIAFAKSCKLELGDMVVSAGINIGDAELSQRLGCAYIANLTRTPTMVYSVTGGTLTGPGSVVFNAAGQAIGLVTSQPYVDCEVMISRKNMNMPLRNDEFTIAFLPVDEFVYILQQIPQDGKARRLPWIGVQRFAPVQKTLITA
ncbi:MAG TPA: serine protease, partial [Phycisphaerae bacterium]|nr:serine protease [Phycisphaerae bacterium]